MAERPISAAAVRAARGSAEVARSATHSWTPADMTAAMAAREGRQPTPGGEGRQEPALAGLRAASSKPLRREWGGP